MEITWHGLLCFRLTERGMATVVTDPFDHQVVGSEALKLKADIVTISFDAPEHNFASAVRGKNHVITGPGEFEIGGVFITGVQTNGRSKRSANEPRNMLFVFDYDGVSVAHLGDLRHVPSQPEIEALGNVNVVLVPVGGGRGLSTAKAVEVVSLLEPGFVIPMHFGAHKNGLKHPPVTKFLKEMGVGNINTQPSLRVSSSNIPDETHVVVLA